MSKRHTKREWRMYRSKPRYSACEWKRKVRRIFRGGVRQAGLLESIRDNATRNPPAGIRWSQERREDCIPF